MLNPDDGSRVDAAGEAALKLAGVWHFPMERIRDLKVWTHSCMGNACMSHAMMINSNVTLAEPVLTALPRGYPSRPYLMRDSLLNHYFGHVSLD